MTPAEPHPTPEQSARPGPSQEIRLMLLKDAILDYFGANDETQAGDLDVLPIMDMIREQMARDAETIRRLREPLQTVFVIEHEEPRWLEGIYFARHHAEIAMRGLAPGYKITEWCVQPLSRRDETEEAASRAALASMSNAVAAESWLSSLTDADLAERGLCRQVTEEQVRETLGFHPEAMEVICKRLRALNLLASPPPEPEPEDRLKEIVIDVLAMKGIKPPSLRLEIWSCISEAVNVKEPGA